MIDEPERRAEIDASLRDVYETLFLTASPTCTKAALNLLGHDAGTLRLPMVEADEAETEAVRAMLERHGLTSGRHGVREPGPRLLSGTLRVLPLGGVGEIGKNMTVVEYDGRIVVVDTGLRFPTAEQMGIDLVLPDFTYLRERVDDIEAVVITHGHEDHVGALPWILRELGQKSVPVVYGGQLTVAMARSKLDEHKLREVALEVLPTGQVARGRAVRRRARSTSRTRSPTRAAWRSGPSWARCSSRATTSSTRRPWAARRRTSRGSPSSAARACCCCAATPRTPTARACR